MADFRTINEHYAEVGADLIRTDSVLKYIADSEVSIVYLSSEQEKKASGKLVFGQCEKVPDKYKWAVQCDFTITVFEPNVERFTDKQIRILLLHELLHIGIELDGNEEVYSIVPHDVEDFRLILDRYGMDWNEQDKA
ncbi:MAG: hypothetical protein IJH28_05350 [Mogibacterium sp.]|nr:hypothetical protein [Mogibacterium sp.]